MKTLQILISLTVHEDVNPNNVILLPSGQFAYIENSTEKVTELYIINPEIHNCTDSPDDTITITWSIEDFESRAIENEEWQHEFNKRRGKTPRKLYDRSKFREALQEMNSNHDCEMGITWDTVDNYLDEFCKINPIKND